MAFPDVLGSLILWAALASSLGTVALLALPGTAIHLLLGHIDWQLTAWLALGVFPSTYLE